MCNLDNKRQDATQNQMQSNKKIKKAKYLGEKYDESSGYQKEQFEMSMGRSRN